MKKLRGFEKPWRPTYRDKKSGERKQSAYWWIRYTANGKRKSEPTNSTKENDAWKLLRQRMAEIGAGKPVGPDVTRTTFEDMAKMLVNDYKANRYSSVNRVEDAIQHLRGYFFGDCRAIEITSDRVTAYITSRQAEHA